MANSFNLLRLLAALLVVVQHAFDFNENVFKNLSLGPSAVHIFFIISGYLISQSWNKDPNILRFTRKRALRLFPALFTLAILTVFVFGPLVTTVSLAHYFSTLDTWLNLLGTMFAFQGPAVLPGVFEHNPIKAINGSLWTLRYEIVMYGLVAIVGTLVHASNRKAAYLAILVFFVLAWAQFILRGIPHQSLPLPFLWKIGLSYECVVFAKLGAFYFAGASMYLWRDRIPLSLNAACGLLFTYLLLSPFDKSFVLQLLLFPYVFIALAWTCPPAAAKCLGDLDLSYGTYIYSYPIQQLVYQELHEFSILIQLCVALGFTLICAWLSWRSVEKPMLAKKKAGAMSGGIDAAYNA